MYGSESGKWVPRNPYIIQDADVLDKKKNLFHVTCDLKFNIIFSIFVLEIKFEVT